MEGEVRSPPVLNGSDTIEFARQIGRAPRGDVRVAARCPAGHPCVMATYPLRWIEGSRVPFPTLYWLTCPALRAAVSRLERAGVIAEVRAMVASDFTFRDQLRFDHENYIAQRWAALSPDDRELVSRDTKLHNALRTRGIGGAGDRAAVKCLHMHLAHALAESNAIGQWLIERYHLRLCDSERTHDSKENRGHD